MVSPVHLNLSKRSMKWEANRKTGSRWDCLKSRPQKQAETELWLPKRQCVQGRQRFIPLECSVYVCPCSQERQVPCSWSRSHSFCTKVPAEQKSTKRPVRNTRRKKNNVQAGLRASDPVSVHVCWLDAFPAREGTWGWDRTCQDHAVVKTEQKRAAWFVLFYFFFVFPPLFLHKMTGFQEVEAFHGYWEEQEDGTGTAPLVTLTTRLHSVHTCREWNHLILMCFQTFIWCKIGSLLRMGGM